MTGLVVREATASDVAGVVRLERDAVEAPHWPEEEYAAIVGQLRENVLARRCFFVAAADDGVIGFAVGKAIGWGASGGAELESVAVDARARRTGVARKLCNAVIAWCSDAGLGKLELEVRASSEGAIALYRALGFVEAGRRRGYYRQPHEYALLMRLDLAG